MQAVYENFLFSKGFFVAEEGRKDCAVETLVSLAKLFGIQIVSGAEMAQAEMIATAARNLGENVPEPFYRGFPETVRKLTPDALLLDQLIHYTMTYGFGLFSVPGHSLFEEEVERTLFGERTEVKPFRILTREEAEKLIRESVDDLLSSTRPLNGTQYTLVLSYLLDYAYQPKQCACKDTVVRLLLNTRDASLARFLSLSDVIRLVEFIQYEWYDSRDIKHLNLRNQHRRFLSQVLDTIFREGKCDVKNCFEKRRLWRGLLHHIHYKPAGRAGEAFVRDIRNGGNRSAYAAFEAQLAQGDIPGAVDTLIRFKGTAAVLRNMNYILSRCRTEEDVTFLMGHIRSKNKIVLLQQLVQYSHYHGEKENRVFRFSKFNKLRVHKETPEEMEKRRSGISTELIPSLCASLRRGLADVCKGTLGKVYVEDAMKRTALPLQENMSMGGVGVLPKGSRIPIGDGKKIRAFTYWERVRDIDLSAIGLTEDGRQQEFSWRSMAGRQSMAITFSGDVTNGWQGGSEYFDIVIPEFQRSYPKIRYLVFCDNVFSGTTFDKCFCKAGYMMRDEEDSGAVFEPKTVSSSFQITCDSRFAYLFALDLAGREMIWLNLAKDSRLSVAGASALDFLRDYMDVTKVINLYDFAVMLASELVDRPEEADVVFSDRVLELPETARQIRSCDIEKVMALLNV